MGSRVDFSRCKVGPYLWGTCKRDFRSPWNIIDIYVNEMVNWGAPSNCGGVVLNITNSLVFTGC